MAQYTELNDSSLKSSNLKAYYRFESGALTTDSSGNSHSLTAISDPSSATGIFGGAVYLDGDDAYSATDHADFKPTGNFTVGFWINTTYTPAAAIRICQSSGSATTTINGWYIRMTVDGYIQFYSGRNTGLVEGTDWQYTQSSYAINDGNWHMVICVYNGSRIYIYIDNNSSNSSIWTYGAGYLATNYVRIGCRNSTGSDTQFLEGNIDDWFIFNGTALTAAAVTSLWSSNISKSESITITESLGREEISFINKTESISVTDTPIRCMESFVNKSESVTISESNSNTLRDGLQISVWYEEITVSDQVTWPGPRDKFLTDNITATEKVTVKIIKPSNVGHKPSFRVNI